MKNLRNFVIAAAVSITVSVGTINANVYVFGIVVDTFSTPIPEASIVVSTMGGPGGGVILDTLTSGIDGKFAKDIVYSQDLERIRYTVYKQGYRAVNGNKDVVQDTADVGTITLRMGLSNTVYVFGTVVDTADNPLTGVQVILSTQGIGGIQILDTLHSGNDGNFAGNVEISSGYVFRINYAASKDGYLTAEGNGNVMRDTCDLDTITLRPGPTPIMNNTVLVTIGTKPDRIKLFNLKGQLLYYGQELNFRKVLQGKRAHSQMFIVHYLLDNTVLYREKITFSQ